MKKIPTLFKRTEDRRHVTDEVTPGCEWVLNGEGVATRKWDGTCVRIGRTWHDGPLVTIETRREVKPGKTPPAFWVEVDHDETTGKRVGWEPYQQSGFAKFIDEAINTDEPDPDEWPEGTYELIGPKINGNPDNHDAHVLRRHGLVKVPGWTGRSFEDIRRAVTGLSWEGVVFHHPDGRMAKIKRRDFANTDPKEQA